MPLSSREPSPQPVYTFAAHPVHPVHRTSSYARARARHRYGNDYDFHVEWTTIDDLRTRESAAAAAVGLLLKRINAAGRSHSSSFEYRFIYVVGMRTIRYCNNTLYIVLYRRRVRLSPTSGNRLPVGFFFRPEFFFFFFSLFRPTRRRVPSAAVRAHITARGFRAISFRKPFVPRSYSSGTSGVFRELASNASSILVRPRATLPPIIRRS